MRSLGPAEPLSSSLSPPSSPFWAKLLADGSNRSSELKSFEDVTITTVDGFCMRQDIERIDLLKTDTEGFDLEVLYGATHMLENDRCLFVYSEVTFDDSDRHHTSFNQLSEFLIARNFRFVALYEQYVSRDLTASGYCNALFVNPKSR